MNVGGNGFCWRIARSDEHPGAIENRRGISGVRTWEGEPGGLWRSLGHALQKLVGNGFSSTLFVRSTGYRRIWTPETEPFDFVFEGISADIVGDFGFRGGGCVRLEIDRWDADLGSPPGSVILATSDGIDVGGFLSGEEYITTPRALDGSQNAKVRADMVIIAIKSGGAV